MAYSEPYAITAARRQKAAEQFPVLGSTDAGDALQVDNWASQQGTPPSDFTQAATRIGAAVADPGFDASEPDTAPNVIPWTSVARGSNFDYFNPQQVTNAPTGAGENAPSASAGQTLGTIGRGISSFLGGEVPEALRPDSGASFPEQQRASKQVIEGAIMSSNIPAGVKSSIPAMGAFDQFITPADLHAAAPEAFQIGRAASDDLRNPQRLYNPQGENTSVYSQFFPDAEGFTHAEDLASARSVDDFLTSRGIEIKGMLEKDKRALAGDLFAQERGAGGPPIAGEAPNVAGGAEASPEEFMRSMQEKASAGEAPSPEEHARLMNMLGEAAGATPAAEQGAAREAFYNAPENLGGGEGLSPEQQANVAGTVQRAGQLNTIRDSLANAREGEATDPFARYDTPNHDALPEPTRTVPSNLSEIQARAQRIARGEPPTVSGGADIPGSEPFMAPRTVPQDAQGVSRLLDEGQQATFPGMENAPPPKPTFGDRVRDVLGAPMAAKSTYDLSAPGRQLASMLYAHPTAIDDVLKAQGRALRSADAFRESQAALAAKPYAIYRDLAGVELGGITKNLVREEQINSNLAQKFLPKSVRFNDAYTAAINEGRDWLFKNLLDQVDPALLTERGLANGGMDELQHIGKIVNASTGRGTIAKVLTENKILGQPLLWAPKLLAGRIQLPFEMFSSSPIVRKEAARQVVSFVGTNLAILGMIKASGVADVEFDPRSSDWGTIRIGNRRYDPWAGYKPLVNLVARLGVSAKNTLGENVPQLGLASDTPNTKRINTPAGQGALAQTTALRIVENFLRAKLAPVPGEVVNQVQGSDVTGAKVDQPLVGPEGKTGGRLEHAAIGQLAPIFLESLAQELGYTVPEGARTGGLQGAGVEGAKSLLGNVPYFFGTGGGYYTPSPPTGGGSARPARAPVRRPAARPSR